eukprot:scaffold126_cov315-Pavlova_lutheri.AAC.36
MAMPDRTSRPRRGILSAGLTRASAGNEHPNHGVRRAVLLEASSGTCWQSCTVARACAHGNASDARARRNVVSMDGKRHVPVTSERADRRPFRENPVP